MTETYKNTWRQMMWNNQPVAILLCFAENNWSFTDLQLKMNLKQFRRFSFRYVMFLCGFVVLELNSHPDHNKGPGPHVCAPCTVKRLFACRTPGYLIMITIKACFGSEMNQNSISWYCRYTEFIGIHWLFPLLIYRIIDCFPQIS